MSLVEQELPTLPEHLSLSPVLSGVRVTRSLVLYVCSWSFCSFPLTIVLFVLLPFSFGHCVICPFVLFLWPLCYLPFCPFPLAIVLFVLLPFSFGHCVICPFAIVQKFVLLLVKDVFWKKNKNKQKQKTKKVMQPITFLVIASHKPG